MSTADFLFQNQAPSAWTSPSWSNTQSPEWWQAAAQGLITRASQVAGQPYQSYSGPRIAGLDPMQTGAIAAGDDYIPGVNNVFGAAQGSLTDAGDLFNQDDFNQFMSPYTTGVVDRIADLGARNLSEKLLPEVNDTFIKAGQFGSSRNADFTLRALRDTNESILGQQATALQEAQKAAMGNYQTAQGRQLQSGQALGALGQLMGSESRDQINNMLQLGGVNQAQEQKNLDLAAQDFENQVAYPQKQLEMLNSIIRGYSGNLGQTTTSYKATPSATMASPLQKVATALNSSYGSQSVG